MRWYYWPLFALIMGFALGGSFEATYFKPIQNSVTIEHNDKAQQSTNQENEKRCEERQFWPRTFCDPTANFTLWLAGLTGILAVFTVGLWFVTLGIFRDSKQSAERQQRAYVMVEGADFEY